MTTCPTPRLKAYNTEADVPAKAYLCACGNWHAKPRRPRGDGGLYKTGDGRWTARVELPRAADGTRRWKRISRRNRNDAINELKKIRKEVDSGRIAATDKATVEQWLHRWLTEIHRGKIRPGTYQGYERIIRLHINPRIGDKRLDKLTAAHIRQMQESIDSTRNAQLAHVILQRALRDAEREGLIGRNVALLVDKPGHVPVEREPLTADQAKHLLRSAIDTHDPWATRWAAALLLGARQGECLGLTWDRVDLDAGVVDFSLQLQQLPQVHGCGTRHSDDSWPCGRKAAAACPKAKVDVPRTFKPIILDGALALTPPKTKARVVPIPAPLGEMLKRHPRGRKNPHNLVWHLPDGRPQDRYSDYQAWQAALSTAGLPAAPLHIARHTTATLLMQAGVPEEIRMAILGHAGAQVHRGYAHVDLSLSRAAMDGALKGLLG